MISQLIQNGNASFNHRRHELARQSKASEYGCMTLMEHLFLCFNSFYTLTCLLRLPFQIFSVSLRERLLNLLFYRGITFIVCGELLVSIPESAPADCLFPLVTRLFSRLLGQPAGVAPTF